MNALDLIREVDPYAGREPDMDRLDAALERIVALPDRPPRRVRRPRRAALALAAVACLAAVVVAFPGGHRVAPASAATVLRDARVAVLGLDGPGPWTVVETRDWRNEPPGGAVPYLTETWSADDGAQLTRVTRGVPGGPADTPMVPPESGFERKSLIAPEVMAKAGETPALRVRIEVL